MYIIINIVFYRSKAECKLFVSGLTVKELALLYLYVDICLLLFLNKKEYSFKKSKPTPFFLSSVVKRIPNCLEKKRKLDIEILENKSLEIHILVPLAKKKGYYINEEDHPSLIEPIKEVPKKKKNQKIEEEKETINQLGYKSRPKI